MPSRVPSVTIRLVFLLVLGVCSSVAPVARAQGGRWVDRATADREVAWLTMSGGVVRLYCHPCRDATSELVAFETATATRDRGGDYEVRIDGRAIDAARTYVSRAGGWYNLAVLVQLEVSGHPMSLADVLPNTPAPPEPAPPAPRPEITIEAHIARTFDTGVFGYFHTRGAAFVILGEVPSTFGVGDATLLARAPWVVTGRRLAADAPAAFRALEGAPVRVVRADGTYCDLMTGVASVIAIASDERVRAEFEDDGRPSRAWTDAQLIETAQQIGRAHATLAVAVPDTCEGGAVATRVLDRVPRVLTPLGRSRSDRAYEVRYRARPGYARELLEPHAEGVRTTSLWVSRYRLDATRELALVAHTYESYGNMDEDTVVIGSALYVRDGTTVRESSIGMWDPGVLFDLGDGELVSVQTSRSTETDIAVLSLVRAELSWTVRFYANDNLGN